MLLNKWRHDNDVSCSALHCHGKAATSCIPWQLAHALPTCAACLHTAGTQQKQYAWDGRRLRALEAEDWEQGAAAARTLRGRIRHAVHDLRSAFFPNPDEVSPGGAAPRCHAPVASPLLEGPAELVAWRCTPLPPPPPPPPPPQPFSLLPPAPPSPPPLPPPPPLHTDYWDYSKYRAWHRLFSSMSSIFATQARRRRPAPRRAPCCARARRPCGQRAAGRGGGAWAGAHVAHEQPGACLPRHHSVACPPQNQRQHRPPSLPPIPRRSRCCKRWAWAPGARCRPPPPSTGCSRMGWGGWGASRWPRASGSRLTQTSRWGPSPGHVWGGGWMWCGCACMAWHGMVPTGPSPVPQRFRYATSIIYAVSLRCGGMGREGGWDSLLRTCCRSAPAAVAGTGRAAAERSCHACRLPPAPCQQASCVRPLAPGPRPQLGVPDAAGATALPGHGQPGKRGEEHRWVEIGWDRVAPGAAVCRVCVPALLAATCSRSFASTAPGWPQASPPSSPRSPPSTAASACGRTWLTSRQRHRWAWRGVGVGRGG